MSQNRPLREAKTAVLRVSNAVFRPCLEWRSSGIVPVRGMSVEIPPPTFSFTIGVDIGRWTVKRGALLKDVNDTIPQHRLGIAAKKQDEENETPHQIQLKLHQQYLLKQN